MAGIPLPPLVQKIVLDPSGLMAGSTAAAGATNKVTKASTKAAQAVTSMSTSMNTLSFRAQTTGRLLFRNIGLPLLAIGGLALKTFSTFERSMVKIEALVGISAGAVENFAEKVKEVSRATGRGPQELADAMFFVTSAGLRGAAALEVMEASAKGAAIGLGETSVVADAATSAVNAYGSENLNGAAAVDVLTAAVREGKVEATRLTPAIGKAIPVASAMGIQFHEVAAAIAAMTRTGTDARTSAIQLRQIMQSILDPSRQTTTALKQMGVAEGELADMARRKGLLAVLTKLRDLSKDNAEAFADVFPNVRALAGAMDITGENLQENTQIFQELANAAGDTDEALQSVEKTAAHKMRLAITDLQVSFNELGEAMLPLIDLFTKVIRAVAATAEWLATHSAVLKLVMGFGMLTAALGLSLIVAGRMAQAGIFLVAVMGKLTIGAGAATVAVGGLGIAMKTLLISSGIGIAILALGTAMAFLTGGFWGFGNESKTAARSARNLRDELRDVRTAGEEVINPIKEITGALKEFTDESESARFATRFLTEFQSGVDDALDISQSAGAFQSEEALMTFFFGRGDTPAVRSALRELVRNMVSDIGPMIDAEGKRVKVDPFFRLFGGSTADGGVVNEEQLSAFLAGDEVVENVIAAAELKGRVAADHLTSKRDELSTAYSDALTGDISDVVFTQQTPHTAATGDVPWARGLEQFLDSGYFNEKVLEDLLSGKREDWVEQIGLALQKEALDMGSDLDVDFFDVQWGPGGGVSEVLSATLGDVEDAAEAIGPFADDLKDALAHGQVGDFVAQWSGFSQGILDASMEAQGAGASIAVAERDLANVFLVLKDNLKESLDLPDEVFENAETFGELMSNINMAAQARGSGTNVPALANVEQISAKYALAIGNIEQRNVMLGISMSQAAIETEALDDIMTEWLTTTRKNSELEAGINDIEGAFAELETRFSSADKAAKKLNKRFDDLIGRSMGVGEAQDELNEGLVKMTESFNENGTGMDSQTEIGKRNREMLRENIEASIEFGEAIIRAGGDSEEAASQVEGAIGALMGNALAQGMDPGELRRFLENAGMTSENIALLFADDGDEIPAAMQDTLDGIINTEEMHSWTTGLASGLGDDVAMGFIAGMEGAAPEVIAAARKMIQQSHEAARDEAISESPSRLFWMLGADIGDGAAQGIEAKSHLFYFQGKNIVQQVSDGLLSEVPKFESVMKDFVDAAMSAASRRMNTVGGAITAVLDLEEAKAAMAEAEMRHGGKGVDTAFERLTGAKLQRNLREAQRALRLGQGNIEDLELAVLEADFAISEFDRKTALGAEVTRAQLGTMDAGANVVETQTELKIEGEAAIRTFEAMGTAVGLTNANLTSLAGLRADDGGLWADMTSPEFQAAVAAVAQDMKDFAEAAASAAGAKVPVIQAGDVDVSGGNLGLGGGASFGSFSALTGLHAGFEQTPALGAGSMRAYPGAPTGDNFGNGAIQNQANITVILGPGGVPQGSAGQGQIGATLGSVIKDNVEKGLLDGWLINAFSLQDTAPVPTQPAWGQFVQ